MMHNKPTTPIVYIVDDEYAVRDSLKLLIETTGYTVVDFESAEAFLDHYNPDQPSCMLLDVRMPSMSGLDLQEELLKRSIDIPIIFISGHADVPDSAKAFRAGAIDFLEKPFNEEVLLSRIEEALSKDAQAREHLREKSKILERLNHLTTREREVLNLIVRSHSNKEAARILDISNRTIDVHRAHIMEKMQAENLAELMVMAMQCDLL